MTRTTAILLLVAVPLLGACSPRRPTEQLAAARQSVEMALRSGTEPSASPSLAMAQRKLSEAEDAMDGGRYREARRLSEEAAVDAEYAQVESEAVRARQSRDDVLQTEQLHQRIQ